MIIIELLTSKNTSIFRSRHTLEGFAFELVDDEHLEAPSHEGDVWDEVRYDRNGVDDDVEPGEEEEDDDTGDADGVGHCRAG